MQRNVVQRTLLRGSKAILKIETLSHAEVTSFDSLASVGGKVWPSAEHLVSYFEKNNIDVSGKSILELGSGCGYTGIALAALGASRVVLTDQLIKQNRLEYDFEGCLVENSHIIPSKILLDLCRDNIELNKAALKHSNVAAFELEWGEQNGSMLQNFSNDRFDMILGSDLTYVPEATEALFWTVSQFLLMAEKENYESKFIVAHQNRRENSTAFALECAKQFGLLKQTLFEGENISIWEFNITKSDSII